MSKTSLQPPSENFKNSNSNDEWLYYDSDSSWLLLQQYIVLAGDSVKTESHQKRIWVWLLTTIISYLLLATAFISLGKNTCFMQPDQSVSYNINLKK
ncbi:hypothetical protein [Gloeothece verrucosa]|uniref:Uncharacterized protein n=1 Tax=Gloeothece verrucosa (strain PCC 7822) TaxID=497965 RepID=E0UCI0_GLOV7|nr:hypothetical protein [Gloeothece verrucosa]ADN14051.1 hypothetical protein Cyan7822_2069 [Gloeothece verrucosa PCC 7822]